MGLRGSVEDGPPSSELLTNRTKNANYQTTLEMLAGRFFNANILSLEENMGHYGLSHVIPSMPCYPGSSSILLLFRFLLFARTLTPFSCKTNCYQCHHCQIQRGSYVVELAQTFPNNRPSTNH